MLVKTNTKEEITFDIEGADASAMIEDNKIIRADIFLPADEENNCLHITDEKFLRDSYKAIGDLLRHVDNKRNVGHRNIDLIEERIPGSAIRRNPEFNARMVLAKDL